MQAPHALVLLEVQKAGHYEDTGNLLQLSIYINQS